MSRLLSNSPARIRRSYLVLVGVLHQLDDLQIIVDLNVVCIERSEENELVLPVLFGVVDHVCNRDPPVAGIHENVKLIQNPENKGFNILCI